LKNPTAIPKKRTLLEAFLHPGPNPLDVDEFLTFINQAPVAKSHSKSDEIFFKEYYSMWTKPFTGFDVVLEFLWVTPERREIVEHAPSTRNWPAHKENYILLPCHQS